MFLLVLHPVRLAVPDHARLVRSRVLPVPAAAFSDSGLPGGSGSVPRRDLRFRRMCIIVRNNNDLRGVHGGPAGRVPAGGRRSQPGAPSGPVALRALRPCGPRAGRRPAFPAVCAIGTRGPTRLAALRAACRPEAGVPRRYAAAESGGLCALRAHTGCTADC